MEFGNSIHRKYIENLSKYPDLLDIYYLLDEMFFMLFGIKADSMDHDLLLRSLSSMRRNYILGVFLFGAEQSSSGIQSMRTMIESGELICSCLIHPQKFFELTGNRIDSDENDLKSMRDQILLKWVKTSSNQTIMETLSTHKKTKDILNSTIAHANPMHNLIAGSGNSDFDFIFTKDLYLDGKHGQSFKEYFLLISNSLHSLLLLIYQISLEINCPHLKLNDINIFREIDNKLSKII